MTRVVEACTQECTVLVKDSPPSFVVSVVKGLERQIDNNASWRNAELDVPWGRCRKPPKEDLARTERAAKFLFKMIMWRLDLIARRVEERSCTTGEEMMTKEQVWAAEGSMSARKLGSPISNNFHLWIDIIWLVGEIKLFHGCNGTDVKNLWLRNHHFEYKVFVLKTIYLFIIYKSEDALNFYISSIHIYSKLKFKPHFQFTSQLLWSFLTQIKLHN